MLLAQKRPRSRAHSWQIAYWNSTAAIITVKRKNPAIHTQRSLFIANFTPFSPTLWRTHSPRESEHYSLRRNIHQALYLSSAASVPPDSAGSRPQISFRKSEKPADSSSRGYDIMPELFSPLATPPPNSLSWACSLRNTREPILSRPGLPSQNVRNEQRLWRVHTRAHESNAAGESYSAPAGSDAVNSTKIRVCNKLARSPYQRGLYIYYSYTCGVFRVTYTRVYMYAENYALPARDEK